MEGKGQCPSVLHKASGIVALELEWRDSFEVVKSLGLSKPSLHLLA